MSDGKLDTCGAFMLGMVAGGVTAILLAPTSGPELRRRISDTGERFRDETRQRAQDAIEDAERRARGAVDEARRALDQVRAVADRQRAAVRRAYEEGRRAYERELAGTGAEEEGEEWEEEPITDHGEGC